MGDVMFFGNNKQKDEEIAQLRSELQSANQKLIQKESEITILKSELSLINKDELVQLKLENKKLKEIALVSQEEGLMAFKADGTLYFANTRAQDHVKANHYADLFRSASNNEKGWF